MTIPFIIHDWHVSPDLLKLHKRGQEVALEPKVMELLLYLANHAGQLVSKDELLDQVWQGRHVSEDVLTVTISNLRKALGDQAKQPTFIQTIPRRGYRFIANVRSSHNASRELARQAFSWFQQRWPIFAGSCFGLLILAVLWQGVSKADPPSSSSASYPATVGNFGANGTRGYSPTYWHTDLERLGPFQVPQTHDQLRSASFTKIKVHQPFAMVLKDINPSPTAGKSPFFDHSQIMPYGLPWPFTSVDPHANTRVKWAGTPDLKPTMTAY